MMSVRVQPRGIVALCIPGMMIPHIRIDRNIAGVAIKCFRNWIGN